MQELISGLVYYKIFDKTYKDSSHRYIKKNKPVSELEIAHNKEAIINYFNAQDILILNQVHGNQIIDADNNIIECVKGDGSITTTKKLVLAIQTADCVPVLLAGTDGKVIGAAHCGWSGAKANIINNLVEKMKEKGARDLVAVIGPAIAQSSYEVDEQYRAGFLSEEVANARFFIDSVRANHYMFDLPGFVISKLRMAGIKNIINLTEDTYSAPLKYPSYRRSSHMQQPYNENILSAIIIL